MLSLIKTVADLVIASKGSMIVVKQANYRTKLNRDTMNEKMTQEFAGGNRDRPRKQEDWTTKNLLMAIMWAGVAVTCFSTVSHSLYTDYRKSRPGAAAESLEKCAWRTLEPHASLLDVAPIGRPEFLARQDALASALRDAGADAFVAEPSASSEYYANVSSSYSLSERPFLVMVDRAGAFSYLVPRVEAGRVARLDMVHGGEKTVVEWRE